MWIGEARCRLGLTYILAEPCIDIKDRSCVDVCPIDCIHEAGRILVIDQVRFQPRL
jgi:NAD-dependent dihydropyrimidine dehydrogenase PreA subunit